MPLEFRIEPNEEAITKFTEKVKETLDLAVKYAAVDVWGGIKKHAPTDEGRLSGSFTLEKEVDWHIRTNVHYAWYVHEGTGIYGPQGTPIVPVRAKALAFSWQGEMAFFTSVRGQEPNPFADRAIADAETKMDHYVRMAINATAEA